jgi:hypothetical protein
LRHDHFDRRVNSVPTQLRTSVHDDPYFLLFTHIVQICIGLGDTYSPNEKMDFIFDEQNSLGQDAIITGRGLLRYRQYGTLLNLP